MPSRTVCGATWHTTTLPTPSRMLTLLQHKDVCGAYHIKGVEARSNPAGKTKRGGPSYVERAIAELPAPGPGFRNERRFTTQRWKDEQLHFMARAIKLVAAPPPPPLPPHPSAVPSARPETSPTYAQVRFKIKQRSSRTSAFSGPASPSHRKPHERALGRGFKDTLQIKVSPKRQHHDGAIGGTLSRGAPTNKPRVLLARPF